MHIAFAASECVPFSKTGGLADVIGALPPALANLGLRVTVFVPRYRQTKLENPRVVIPSITVPFDDVPLSEHPAWYRRLDELGYS